MGIGAWPDPQTVEKHLAGRAPKQAAVVLEVQQSLKRYGYDQIPQTGELDDDTRKTISAFQMHFRPADYSGNADAQTEAIAKALVEKYRQ
jgi:N-acetylmuramoyl-L-alanine amidase